MNPAALFDRHPWSRWALAAIVAVAGIAVWMNAEQSSVQIGEPVLASGFEHVVTDVTCFEDQCTVTMQVTNLADDTQTWHPLTPLFDTANRRFEPVGAEEVLAPGATHTAQLTYRVLPGSLAQHLTIIADPSEHTGPTVRIR